MMHFFRRIRGALLLLLAAAIWGFAFTAQTAAAETVPPFTFNGVRSVIGGAVLLIYLQIRSRKEKKQGNIVRPPLQKSAIVGGIACGVALFVAVNFQQFGISAYPDGVPVSSRGGFITALYVILVPICGMFFHRKISGIIWVSAAISLGGMYLLCFQGGISGLYWGDILVFMCALAFTAHILVVDHFAQEVDGVTLSCIQFFTCGALSLIGMLLFESPDWTAVAQAWLPLLYAGVLSSGVAYTLQIVGQRSTDPTVAPLVMSLESVFAGLGGWAILGERMSLRELAGCGLVFAAVVLAQMPEILASRHAKV